MAMFHEVSIEEALWQCLDAQKVHTIINEIANYFEHCIIEGQSNSPKIKAIRGQGNYKYYLNDKERIPFKFYQAIDENKSHRIESTGLFLGRVLSHEEGEDLHRKEYDFGDLRNFPASLALPVYEHTIADEIAPPFSLGSLYRIYREWTPGDLARLTGNANSDLRFRLSQEQKEIVKTKSGEPILLKGAAGCGKTTVSIYRLLELPSGSKALYVTYTPGLREYAKSSFERLSSGLEEIANVEFITIEKLCLRTLKPEKSLKFLPSRKMTFSIFKSLGDIRDSRIDPYLVWNYIQGYRKQPNKDNLDSGYSRGLEEKLDSLYNKYEEHLRARRMWDNIDLVQSALECLRQGDFPRWDHIVVDEVQDLTERHVHLLARLASKSVLSPRQSASLLMAGDNSQIIHPSMFKWEQLQSAIKYELDIKGQLNCHVRSLNTNYRIPIGIMELAHKIQGPNSQDLVEIQPIKQEVSRIHLIDINEFHNFSVDILPSTVMVIVPSEERKREAQKIFGKNSVFTIYEAKGLENKNIVVYGFFEDPDIARILQRLFIFNQNTRPSIKHLINLLYVAVTRTEEKLFIVSKPKSVRKLSSLKDFEFYENDGSELKEILRSPETDPEVYFKWATTNDRQENWEQARVNYLRAFELGHPQAKNYADRCQFLMAMSIHDYQKADKWSEQALLTNEDSVSVPYYECKGHIVLHQGDLEAALGHFQTAQIDHARIIETICNSEVPERYKFSFRYILGIDDDSTRRTLARWFLKNKSRGNFCYSLDIADVLNSANNDILIPTQNIDLAEDYQKYKVEFIRGQQVDPNLRSIKGILRLLEEPPYSSPKEVIAHIIRERVEKIENHLRVQGLHTKQKEKDEISAVEKAEKNDRQLRNLEYVLDDTPDLEEKVIQEIVSSKDIQVYQLSLKLPKITLRSLPSLSSDLLLKIARNSNPNFLKDKNNLEVLILQSHPDNDILIQTLVSRGSIDLFFLIDLFKDNPLLFKHEDIRDDLIISFKEEALFILGKIHEKLDELRKMNSILEKKVRQRNSKKINAASQQLSRLISVTENNVLKLKSDDIKAFRKGLGGLKRLPVTDLNSLLSRLHEQ